MGKALLSGALGLPALVALVLGPGPFAVVLVAAAVAVTLDAAGLLARVAARPILPAALVPAAGLPAAVALQPQSGWDLVPAFAAGGFLATFLFALLFGRRRGIVQGAGTTMLVGLVVGLGAASLLLLRGLPDGFRWVLAFAVVVLAADLGSALWEQVRRGRRGSRAAPDRGLGGAVAGALLAGVGVLVVLRPPLAAPVAGLLTLVALTAAVGAADLQRALLADGETAPPAPPRLGDGMLFGIADGMLFAAPAVYVLARSAVL